MPKILTCDDSKMVHMVVKRALKPYDVDVVTASSGAEGVLKAVAEKPDLILMDVTMPGMTGHEALARIKANPETAHIPVIMLTAETSGESQERAFEAGVYMYLGKPFADDFLVSSLSTVLPLQPRPS